MRWLVVVCVVLAALPAQADGTDPGALSIHFRRGNEQYIAAGTTHDLWAINTDYETYQEAAVIGETGLVPAKTASAA